MNTVIDVKTTQEGSLRTTGDCPRDVSAGTWIGVPEIDAAAYAREHTPKGLDSLGVDLGKNGQLQNIVLVKKADGRYECIIGNGRLEAAKKLGWSHIRADVKEGLSLADKLLMTLAENGEREDMNPFDIAKLHQMIKEATGLEEAALAERLGIDLSVLNRSLALLKLAPEVQANLARAKLSMRHLREITRLSSPEDQLKMAEACEKGDWSCKVLKAKVDKALAGSTEKEAKAPEEPASAKGPFQFTRKGKFLVLKTKMPPVISVIDDVYMQDLRIAMIDFVAQENEKDMRRMSSSPQVPSKRNSEREARMNQTA